MIWLLFIPVCVCLYEIQAKRADTGDLAKLGHYPPENYMTNQDSDFYLKRHEHNISCRELQCNHLKRFQDGRPLVFQKIRLFLTVNKFLVLQAEFSNHE